MSEKDYLALPEEKPYLEYVDGVVLQKPMPNANHRKLVTRFVVALDAYASRAGGDSGPEGRIAFQATSNFRLPDAAFWGPGVPSGDDSIPTLVVAVRSPQQTLTELRQKYRFFRRNGVEVAWLVDPETRAVEVFEGNRDADRLAAPAVLTSPALPGFELDLAALFAVLDS